VADPKPADLVLSGGGVKGIGLVGAVVALMDAGYRAQRVSGTSAGSIVGAVVAAASMGDQLSPEEVKELALQLDYHKFTDPGPSSVFRCSAHRWRCCGGRHLQGRLRTRLGPQPAENLGVRTFGDLAIRDDSLPAEQRYKLVVTVADVTTGQLVRLPWDYRRVYGLDPDEQSVADAVRASMAIPFFFRPVMLQSTTGLTSTLVDGGILSNFPIDSLDRADGRTTSLAQFRRHGAAEPARGQ
jgi:Predicted esterase of the alpha-beta hydrolase superfamily